MLASLRSRPIVHCFARLSCLNLTDAPRPLSTSPAPRPGVGQPFRVARCEKSLHLSTRLPSATNRMPGTLLATDPRLDVVPDVVIDDSGVFKYILCKVYLSDAPSVLKHIVRGTKRAEFHAGIYDDIETRLTDTGISSECVGGGKIDHDPVQKTIIVYGLSQGFGRANHALSVELLKKKYPDYASVTWKND